ncbi:hypothetical protein M9H77_06411 [Catharanthus roseus]|uniref:Uncharacterized protein n=1 Tax=Catharanthus roseus TaxID=4058 RepID=A0ACC0BS83_CATRO|nr:hypothetical protein M9H77_06411 [Catharanthus roseus]
MLRWPTSTVKLIEEKSFIGMSYEEYRLLGKLTAAPVKGHELLSIYLKYIEENVVTVLEKLSMSWENLTLEKEYTTLNYGVRAMANNLPGWSYHNALKRRATRKENPTKDKQDRMDLDNEEIINILVMYLNAGHGSSSQISTGANLLLLTLKEIRQINYLSKVIDETLCVITFSFVVFREAKKDVNINVVWFRDIHFDPEIYPKPKKNLVEKSRTFLPFGVKNILCLGNDLAKLEIAIFLHQLERQNPTCHILFLPCQRPKDNYFARIKRVSPPSAQKKKRDNVRILSKVDPIFST